MADVLIINGERVDLYDKDQAGLNISVNHLGDMTDRDGGYSQSLKAPKTDRNISIFGYSQSLVSNVRTQYTKLECQYYSGGVQLIGNGYAVINDAGKEYSLTLYSGNTSLFQKIDGLKLSDLDLSDFDLMWDFSGIASCYSNTASPTVVLLDNGHVDVSGREIEASEMFFQLFYRDIISAIIQDAGFTFDGSIFSDLEYTQALFPFVNEYPRQGLLEIEQSLSKAVNTSVINLAIPAFGSNTTQPLTFSDDSVDGYDANGNLDTSTATYTAPHRGIVKCKGHIVVYIDHISVPSGFVVQVLIKKNGVNTYFGETLTTANVNINENNYIDFEADIECDAGDELEMNLLYYVLNVGAQYTVDIMTGDPITTNGKSYFKFDLDERLLWGGMWRASRNLPDMTQKDFLKMFCQHFGQSFETDEFSGEVFFFNLDEVIALRGLSGSHEWSDYYDSGSAQIKFHSSYAKLNECKFTKDDNVTEFLGDASFVIDDSTLKEKSTSIQLPVASSDTVTRMSGIDMAAVLRFDTDDKELTPKPRILRRVNTSLNDTGSNSYVRIIETGTANTQDFFTSSVGLFTHNFEYMLDRYYTGWIDTLNDYKSVACNMLIPASVIQSFSFTKPIWIAQLSSWFYVNKIENYKQGKLCKVELQRI